MRTLLLLPVLTTVAYLTGRRGDTPPEGAHPRRGSVIGRAVRAFREFNADNIRIWESHLRKQGVGRQN